MSQQQFYEQTRQQEWLEELEARRVEDANEILAEMQASLETKYPQIKATWPGAEE